MFGYEFSPKGMYTTDLIPDTSPVQSLGLGEDFGFSVDEFIDGIMIWWHYWDVMKILGGKTKLEKMGHGGCHL